MSAVEHVRFLNASFNKALILENPDPSLDGYLREQGIAPERLPETATQDIDFVVERLREGQHDLIFKRSRFPVDERIIQASQKRSAASATIRWTRRRAPVRGCW
jgi:D-3-phosphoglycerate dehydrogenase